MESNDGLVTLSVLSTWAGGAEQHTAAKSYPIAENETKSVYIFESRECEYGMGSHDTESQQPRRQIKWQARMLLLVLKIS